MSEHAASERPLQIVTTCRAYDLPVFEIAAGKLAEHVPLKCLYVIAPSRDCREMRRRLGERAQIIPEDDFIPGMNIQQLRQVVRFGFPKYAGWYYQQFLKLQFASVQPEDDFYLIWDADTIPLRPMRFFDSDGRVVLTKATEYHPPYFDTYRRILQEEPHREFSFIAQHMLVQKSIVRELLARIEQLGDGNDHWAWKVIRCLPEIDNLHLFSEFETYGHFVKNHYPERVRFVERLWWRFGSDFTRGRVPSPHHLEKLALNYEFVSFEKATGGWRYMVKWLLGRNPKQQQLPVGCG